MHKVQYEAFSYQWQPKVVQIDLRPIQQERNHTWYWKPSKLPKASEVMNLRKESNSATVLDQHNSLIHSKNTH